MALDHVYVNSKTTNIQIKGAFHSKGQIRSGLRHNGREGKEGSGKHINKELSYLNEEIKSATADEIYLNLCNRLTKENYTLNNMPDKDDIRIDGKKIRSDAVIAYEIEASYPGDMVWSMTDKDGNIIPVPDEIDITPENVNNYFKMPKDMKEFNEWKNATVEFINDRYGSKNIMSISVHMDEDEPHIHAIGLPIIENDDKVRLSYKEISGGRRGLAELQTDYANHVEHLGYKRGEFFSSRIADISTKEYKARLNMALSEKMPDNVKDCQNEILNLRAKNFDLDEEITRTMSSAKTIQKLRIKNDELHKENDKIRLELEKTQRDLKIVQNVLEGYRYKEEAERVGKEIFASIDENKKVMADNFEAAKNQMIEIGTEQLRREGREYINTYLDDLNHDNINDRYQTIDNNHNGADDRSEIDFK